MTDYGARWLLIGVISLVSLIGLRAYGVSIAWEPLRRELTGAAFILIFGMTYQWIGALTRRVAVPMIAASDLFLSVVQLWAVVTALFPLMYLAAAAGFPLRDEALARLDVLLFGFDWDTAAHWVAHHPAVDWALRGGYCSLPFQAVVIVLAGSTWHRGDRNGDLLWSLGIALILTSTLFMFMPTLGKVGHIGRGQIEILTEIRRGAWCVLDVGHVTGIINFPSFHTTLTILAIDAMRRFPRALFLFVPLNLMMMQRRPLWAATIWWTSLPARSSRSSPLLPLPPHVACAGVSS